MSVEHEHVLYVIVDGFVCAHVYVPVRAHAYLLLRRVLLHSQSPACYMKGPGLHSSWLHPYLTEIYSEEQEDTSFLFRPSLPHTTSLLLLCLLFSCPSLFFQSLFLFIRYLLVSASFNSYRHDMGDPWHKRSIIPSDWARNRERGGAVTKTSHLIVHYLSVLLAHTYHKDG